MHQDPTVLQEKKYLSSKQGVEGGAPSSLLGQESQGLVQRPDSLRKRTRTCVLTLQQKHIPPPVPLQTYTPCVPCPWKLIARWPESDQPPKVPVTQLPPSLPGQWTLTQCSMLLAWQMKEQGPKGFGHQPLVLGLQSREARSEDW